MRKTNMKKLSAVVLTMAMATTVAMTAFAVPNPLPNTGAVGDFNQNAATTSVNVVGMTDTEAEANLSAKLPISVLLAVGGDGTVTGPTAYTITNGTTNSDIKVNKLSATAVAGTNYILNGTVGTNDVGLTGISMVPAGATTDAIRMEQMGATGGHTIPNTNGSWTMGRAGANGTPSSINIRFTGTVENHNNLSGTATGNNDGEEAFTVVFTIQKVVTNNP